MRSSPPSGEGLTSGVPMAERPEIRIACCVPATRSPGLLCVTAFSQPSVASCRSRDAAFATPNSTPWLNTVWPLYGPYPFCGTTLMALLDDSVVQSDGTDAWKTVPPRTSRYCGEGGGTGCPGVPTA